MIVGTPIVISVVVGLILTSARRRAEDGYGSANGNSLEKCYGLFLRHPDASMRSRITGQVACVEPYAGSKLHEITHWRIDESSPNRPGHVDIRIQDDGSARAINDAAIDAGDMLQILIGDTKGSGRCQVAGSSRRDWRFHDGAVVVQQINLLLREIELDRVLSQRRTFQTNKSQQRECEKSHSDSVSQFEFRSRLT